MSNLLSIIRHNQNNLFKAILIVVCIGAISFILPRAGSFKYEYPEGKPWLSEDLIAPFDFPIYKDKAEIEKEKLETNSNTKFYFKVNSDLAEQKIKQFKDELASKWETSSFSKNESSFSAKRLLKRIKLDENILSQEYDFQEYGTYLLNNII